MDSNTINNEPQWKETTSHPKSVRVTCNLIGMRNDLGRDKLFAEITPQGVSSYCKYCRGAHIVALEQCLAVWGIVDSRKLER